MKNADRNKTARKQTISYHNQKSCISERYISNMGPLTFAGDKNRINFPNKLMVWFISSRGEAVWMSPSLSIWFYLARKNTNRTIQDKVQSQKKYRRTCKIIVYYVVDTNVLHEIWIHSSTYQHSDDWFWSLSVLINQESREQISTKTIFTWWDIERNERFIVVRRYR